MAVVLPAPLGPRRPPNRPRGDHEINAVQRYEVPEALDQTLRHHATSHHRLLTSSRPRSFVTVSTIVTELVAGGLLERQQAVDDRRTYRLSLTPAAARMMSEGRDRRAEVVAAGLARLSKTDRSRLAAALPALHRLITAIDLDCDHAD